MVGPDDGRVDHLQTGMAAAAIIQDLKDQLPKARLRPSPELAVNA
jgi:hypothetical protein